MLPLSSGSLAAGLLGLMALGGGSIPGGIDTTLSLGLTYYGMIQLLSQKLLYMSGWTIGLYALSTPFTPTASASVYTASPQVPTFTGYAPQSLAGWSAAYLNGLNQVVTTLPLVVWTPGNTLNPGPVAGYYILDAMGQLVGAQENPAGPITVGGTLMPFSVAPSFMEQAIA